MGASPSSSELTAATAGRTTRTSRTQSPSRTTSARAGSSPKLLPTGMGSALPRLLALNGVLLLAGGRPSGNCYDPRLWVDRTGSGSGPWETHSVSAAHNK
jgi:hypothetical protein